jgi:peptide deformylase
MNDSPASNAHHLDEVLLLGDPRLRIVCHAVSDFGSSEFETDAQRLIRALEQFRAEYGFGRAMAAPQIGILRRMIAMNLGKGPFLIVNPVVSVKSPETFTLWDDCMSFPWLMVRLNRHRYVNLDWFDANGAAQRWTDIEPTVAELIQHETDHLDGILAVDHALDRDSVIARRVYEQHRDYFDSQVDYAIVPTIPPSDGETNS